MKAFKAHNECRGEKPTKALGEELVDIILRVLDFAETEKIDIASAVESKMALNEIRGTRGRCERVIKSHTKY